MAEGNANVPALDRTEEGLIIRIRHYVRLAMEASINMVKNRWATFTNWLGQTWLGRFWGMYSLWIVAVLMLAFALTVQFHPSLSVLRNVCTAVGYVGNFYTFYDHIKTRGTDTNGGGGV